MWLKLLHFVNHVPDNTAFWTYNPANDHSVLTLEFWWREMWHFLGGFSLSLLSIVLPSWLVVLSVLIAMSLLEWYTDHDWKSFVDVTFWTLGALGGCLLWP